MSLIFYNMVNILPLNILTMATLIFSKNQSVVYIVCNAIVQQTNLCLQVLLPGVLYCMYTLVFITVLYFPYNTYYYVTILCYKLYSYTIFLTYVHGRYLQTFETHPKIYLIPNCIPVSKHFIFFSVCMYKLLTLFCSGTILGYWFPMLRQKRRRSGHLS